MQGGKESINFIFACLLLVWLFFSVADVLGQSKSIISKDSIQNRGTNTDYGLGQPKSDTEMNSFLSTGIDPYFIDTKDTFSINGPQCIVRNLIQDTNGNYWLATWHGIIKYDGKIFTNFTLKEGLIHFHVTTAFEDFKGNIWFACPRGGIYRYDGKSFTLFTVKDGLPDNTANCITEDQNGNIWFGTENGACYFDGKKFTIYSENNGLSDNFVNAIINDKRGKIWIATNRGIDLFDGKEFKRFYYSNKEPFKQVGMLYKDKIGNIWIGSGAKDAGGYGLCCYNGKSLTGSIIPYYVMYMCEDTKGNLWLAHNKGAEEIHFSLYKYDGKLFTKIKEQQSAENQLIFGIIQDKNGDIWFGTTNGVCRYDRKNFNYFNN